MEAVLNYAAVVEYILDEKISHMPIIDLTGYKSVQKLIALGKGEDDVNNYSLDEKVGIMKDAKRWLENIELADELLTYVTILERSLMLARDNCQSIDPVVGMRAGALIDAKHMTEKTLPKEWPEMVKNIKKVLAEYPL